MSATFTPVIGLEIHVELRTNSKMFCGCPADHFGQKPNTHICPVCFGLPGALPVANGEAIKRTIMVGQALNCTIAKESKFDRKNYFYPDLPKGYQISQYDQPLCVDGVIATSLGDVRITRVHLEEDTAKLQHVSLTAQEMITAKVEHSEVSLLDFNRSGVALVEIVTEPDIKSGEHAREYAKSLVQMLRYLGVSDCDMEKGSLRLEANISVQSEAEKAAGQLPAYKVEVKNLNSFRFLERAISYEIARHTELRQNNEIPKQETRGWNDEKGTTYSQRSKESAEDYRYFPDPDLPTMELSDAFIAGVKEELPELPLAKKARFMEQFGVSVQNVDVITADRGVAETFERFFAVIQSQGLEVQKVLNAVVNKKVESWLLDAEKVETSSAADQESEMLRVCTAVKELSAVESVSEEELNSVIASVLADPASQKALESYRAGKTQVIGFFIGQILRQLGKKIDPSIIQSALQKQLK